jgi:hypothetical protein
MSESKKRGQIERNKSTGTWSANDDRVFGKLTWDEEEGVVLNVDGHTLKVSELGEILTTYEGWYFEIRFIDPTDVVKEVPGVQ